MPKEAVTGQDAMTNLESISLSDQKLPFIYLSQPQALPQRPSAVPGHGEPCRCP